LFINAAQTKNSAKLPALIYLTIFPSCDVETLITTSNNEQLLAIKLHSLRCEMQKKHKNEQTPHLFTLVHLDQKKLINHTVVDLRSPP
jgi:hypothetical protein